MSMGDIHPRKGAGEAHGEPDGDEATVVGLAENRQGVPFRCGTCEYFDFGPGTCHNPHPKLRGKVVKPEWCCNLYHHPGMRVIVK